MAEPTVAIEVPVAAEGDLLPARQVDLRRAVRLGLVGGFAAAFVSANGMVKAFSERALLGGETLGTLLLVAVPLLVGYLAGRPPPVLQGFATPRPGWRNVAGGLLAGLLSGVVMAVFVTLIATFDVRRVLINVAPQLVREAPRLLTFGLELGAGLVLILALNAGLGAVAGTLHLLRERWRRAVFATAVWVLAFAMLQPFVAQVLRGIQAQLRILTAPLNDFLYEPSGALSVAGAVAVGAVAFGTHALLTRKGRRPIRTRLEPLPERSGRLLRLAVLAGALFVLGLLPQVLGPFLSEVLNIAGIFLLMALGLNIVVGFAGLLDLGYVAFFAVGAYVTALLTSPQSSLGVGWIFWAAVPFVVLAAAVAGLVVGTPVLRMRGDYLAIVTLGFGEIARLLFLSDWLKPTFGGAQGIIRVRDITVGPLEIRGPQTFFYAIFVFVLLATYVTYALQDSRVGRAWMAMREDEAVAEAMGVNIVTAKLSAFIAGAMLAGFGGALFATKIGSVFPHSFNVIVSITVLVVIIVGGMASVPGVVLASFVLVGLPELLREFEEYRYLIYGALLIFMMQRRPEGFIPSRRRAQELHEEEVTQDAWLQTRAMVHQEVNAVGDGRRETS
ncbi:MAG TPA: leucine/isoleucine/valine transporter permease subunit [Actinomycetes bacterium]|jgi:branched-chain amino acid transport system permease protein|nr:leucine/isoleucine/valine transporter permease subunit [Actinomycetes bacterium]